MQQFYFDVRDGFELARDEEGILLPDVDAAIKEAKLSLAEIIRGVLSDGTYPGTICVEIRTASGILASVGLTYSVQMNPATLTLAAPSCQASAKLVTRSMSSQLGGAIEREWHPEGVIVSISIDNDRLAR